MALGSSATGASSGERQPLLASEDTVSPQSTTPIPDEHSRLVSEDGRNYGSFILATLGIVLLSWCISLEAQTTSNLTIFATSAFHRHSLVSTIVVLRGTVMAVLKVPLAILGDYFGRLGALTISILLYIIGYLLQAIAPNFQTYALAQFFAAAGFNGVQILIQILIADFSTLADRALFLNLPRLPFLVNVWVGPSLADLLLRHIGWRWGYALWAILLPLAFLPLGAALTLQRSSMSDSEDPHRPRSGATPSRATKSTTDVIGLLILAVALTLILVPMALLSSSSVASPTLLLLLIPGVICICAVPWWESSISRPFFPKFLWANATFWAALAAVIFHFVPLFLAVYSYLESYLLVVHGMSLPEAGRLVQSNAFATTVVSIPVSLVIQYTRRYKIWMIVGTLVYVSGLALLPIYWTEASSAFILIITQIFLGFGSSLVLLCTQLGIQATADPADVAIATALFFTVIDVGSTIGSAIAGSMWSASLLPRLREYLPPAKQHLAYDIYANVTLAAHGWLPGTPIRIAINRAYQQTYTDMLWVALFTSIPCIICGLVMADRPLSERPQQSDETEDT